MNQNFQQDNAGRLLTVTDAVTPLGAWVDRDPVVVPTEPSVAQQQRPIVTGKQIGRAHV